MESLPEVSSSSPDTRSATPRLPHGGRAVALFFLILVGLTGILLWARINKQTATTGTGQQHASTRSKSFALTDEQAIAKFQELNRTGLLAYRRRDPTLVDLAFTSNSPLRKVALREIRQLRNDHVLDRTTFHSRHVSVTVNGPNLVILRQVVAEYPRFVSGRRQCDGFLPR